MSRALGFAVLTLVLIGFAGCSTTGSGSSESETENNPAKNASENNIPKAGPTETVEVDDLRWGVRSAWTTYTLGEAGIDRQTASGIFIVVTLRVTDNKSESVTATSGIVSLIVNGKSYSPDSEVLFGLPGKTLSVTQINPSVPVEVSVAFDVAPQVTKERPELQFNELGFGTTHGYIELPTLNEESTG
jgi:hypothetical protein